MFIEHALTGNTPVVPPLIPGEGLLLGFLPGALAVRVELLDALVAAIGLGFEARVEGEP